MNDSGMIVARGNMEQQMKNCYADLQQILQHYVYTVDDVVAENIYTTKYLAFVILFTKNNFLQVPGSKAYAKILFTHNQNFLQDFLQLLLKHQRILLWLQKRSWKLQKATVGNCGTRWALMNYPFCNGGHL